MQTVRMLLSRRLGPVETAGESNVRLYFFDLKLMVKPEEGQTVAVCDALGGMIAGVGDDLEEAVSDFAQCFQAVVDEHIEEGSHEQFFAAYSQQRKIDIPVQEQQKEEKLFLEKLFPVWMKELEVSHA